MTEYTFAKPREGGRVRRPDQGFRPMREQGESVPRIDYYNRLIITGDLVECDPPVEAAADPVPEPAPVEPEPAPEPPPAIESSSDQPRAPRSSKEK